MSGEFCDRSPCKWFQKLFSAKLMPRAQGVELLVAKPKGSATEPLRRVSLWYCPFCGTRIYDNKDVSDWIQSRIKG